MRAFALILASSLLVSCSANYRNSGEAESDPTLIDNALLLHMDETSWNGTLNEVIDSSGHGNHGTSANGASTTTSGRTGGAGTFDGLNDYVSIPHSASLNATSAMTLEFWLKPSATFSSSATSDQGVFDKGAIQAYLAEADGKLKLNLLDNTAPTASVAYASAATRVVAFTELNGSLYASVTSSLGGTGKVYVCDPAGGGNPSLCDHAADWSLALDGGDVGVPGFAVFNGSLYASSQDGAGEFKIRVCDPTVGGNPLLCDNPADWTQSFAVAVQNFNSKLVVYNGKLYAGRGRNAGDGDIYMCDPALTGAATLCDAGDWSMVYDGTVRRIDSFGVFHGKLYVGLGGALGEGDILICNPATAGSPTDCDNAADWTITYDTAAGDDIYGFAEYGGKLYVAAGGPAPGDARLMVCDPTTAGNATDCDNAADWTEVYQNAAYGDMTGIAVLNGLLYFGMSGTAGQGDLFVCNPTATGSPFTCESGDWSITHDASFDTVHEMYPFDGKIYVATCCSGEAWAYSPASSLVASSSTASWPQTAWTHVAATFDQTNVKLYVNGTLESTTPATFGLATNSFPLILGSVAGPNASRYSGGLDEVAYFTRALSSSEISVHYLRGH